MPKHASSNNEWENEYTKIARIINEKTDRNESSMSLRALIAEEMYISLEDHEYHSNDGTYPHNAYQEYIEKIKTIRPEFSALPSVSAMMGYCRGIRTGACPVDELQLAIIKEHFGITILKADYESASNLIDVTHYYNDEVNEIKNSPATVATPFSPLTHTLDSDSGTIEENESSKKTYK